MTRRRMNGAPSATIPASTSRPKTANSELGTAFRPVLDAASRDAPGETALPPTSTGCGPSLSACPSASRSACVCGPGGIAGRGVGAGAAAESGVPESEPAPVSGTELLPPLVLPPPLPPVLPPLLPPLAAVFSAIARAEHVAAGGVLVDVGRAAPLRGLAQLRDACSRPGARRRPGSPAGSRSGPRACAAAGTRSSAASRAMKMVRRIGEFTLAALLRGRDRTGHPVRPGLVACRPRPHAGRSRRGARRSAGSSRRRLHRGAAARPRRPRARRVRCARAARARPRRLRLHRWRSRGLPGGRLR